MMFTNWLKGLRSAGNANRTQRRRQPDGAPPRFRPRLEAMEDRTVPSTLMVTKTGDDLSAGTLRWAVAHAGNGDTIDFSPALHGAPIVLTQGELLLNHDVTIKATQDVPETISGGGNSRVFEVAAGASVTLRNLTITGGNAQTGNPADPHEGRGGGVVVDEGATLKITNCTVTDNSAPVVAGKGGLGGGIADYGTLTVNDSAVSNNHALGTYGGGIAVFSGAPFSAPFSATLTVRGSHVYGNTAHENGGGITGVSSTLVVRDSTLSGNSTDVFDGGGVNLHGGTLMMTGCTLSGNRAAENGGGAFISTALEGGVVIPATATLRDCTLTGNSVYSATPFGFGEGGGIFNAGTMTVRHCTVAGNSVNAANGLGFGGGIYNSNSGTMTVSDDCKLSGNTAAVSGGGILNGGTMTVSDCRLSGNTAQYGGGILNGGTMTVSDCKLSGNTAAYEGGAIYNLSDLTIDHCTLNDNSAGDSGGAIFNFFLFGNTGLTVSASRISHNTASNFGGGIYNAQGTVTVKNSSVIARNTAPAGSGADVYNFDTLYLDASSIIGILDGNPAVPI